MPRNFASPYAKPIQQYPSQCEDYLSLEIGGPGKCSTPARTQYHNNDREISSSGNYYQNKNRTPGGWYGSRNNFGNFGDHRQYQQRPSFSGGEASRQPTRQRQNNHKQPYHRNNDISAYFHPSMLEDPWKELMARRDAIRKSEINVQLPAKQYQEDDVAIDAGGSGEDVKESGSDMEDAT